MNMDLVRKVFFGFLFFLLVLSILAIIVEELFLGGRKRRAMRKSGRLAVEPAETEE